MPVLQVFVIAIVVVALSIWMYRREEIRGKERLMVVLPRVFVLALIGLLILNPVLVQTATTPSAKPPLLILIDNSHSMSVMDVNGVARLDAVKKALLDDPDLTMELGRNYTPTLFSFSGDATRQNVATFLKDGKANGDKTYIGESLAHALGSAGSAAGAVLIVSDGRNNGEIGPAEVARQAKARGFPVYTVCLGAATTTKDVSIVMNRPQVFTAPDQQAALAGDIVSTGYHRDQVQAQLMREGKVVASKSVTLQNTGHTDVSFPVKEPKKGTYRYSLSVKPLPGEISTANNRASALLTVGNLSPRILLLEGRPTWDAKFLAQALRTDPNVTVDSIFKLTESRYFAVKGGTASASSSEPDATSSVKIPTTHVEFAKYDVVIIGRGFEDFFDEKSAKELQTYVAQDGGHLIFLRGKAADRSAVLASMEPITWGNDEIRDFRMKVTTEGTANPAFQFKQDSNPDVIVQKLPTLISATQVAKEKALTVVLARASGVNNSDQPNREMALLAYQRYGEGLVASLIGEGLWRWALLPPELESYSKCYTDFWNQWMRWMVNQSDFLPGQNISMRTDHFAYSPGEEVNLMVFVRAMKSESLPPVVITQPDGQTVSVKLSKAGGKQADFIGSFRPKIPGDYTASISKPGALGGQVTAPFSVFERRQEDMNTSADPGLMEQIALAGGGEELSLDQLKSLPSKLREKESTFTKKAEPQSIWDCWPVLALLLGLLSAEWLIRRRIGMV